MSLMSKLSHKTLQRVVFQPETYRGLQRGINLIAEAVRPTLGPHPRMVASEHPLRHRLPDLLDEGAVIAQRIIELPDRDEDVGAMMIRHVLMHVKEQAGDGTATAAVLMQSVYNEGIRYIAAGGNAMQLRRFLEEGTRAILSELAEMTTYPEGEEQLAQIASSICHDLPLAAMLGEVVDIVGEYGQIEIQSGQGRTLEREYVEGMHWKNGLLSREMIADHTLLRTELENAAILISDLFVKEPDQLVPALTVAKESGCSSLLVIAQEISPAAMALLLANAKDETFAIAAVKTPGDTPTERGTSLQDMAVLSGGTPFLLAAGYQTMDRIKPQDLGHARRAWADLHRFGIIGGRGGARALRQHIAGLRAAYRQMEDVESRRTLQQRIGKLMGGSAILTVGGATNAEIMARKDLAERAADAIRAAVIEGVLPGAGAALLACRPSLRQRLAQSVDPDERAAFRILIRALEEPARAIAANAGYDPGEAIAQVTLAGPGYGWDVNTGRAVDAAQAGILDVAAAQKAAVQSAIAGAALALTTDVLVHHAKFNWYKPGSRY
jgi:chaperonin GroEL